MFGGRELEYRDKITCIMYDKDHAMQLATVKIDPLIQSL